MVLGCLIITRADLFLGSLLGLRRGCARGRRRSVRLDLLATAPDGGFSSGRRGGLAFGPTSASLRGGFGGLCAGGLLLGRARALGGWPARRRLLFIFNVEFQGLIDCMCPVVGYGIAWDETSLAESRGRMGRTGTGRTTSCLYGAEELEHTLALALSGVRAKVTADCTESVRLEFIPWDLGRGRHRELS